MHCASTSSGPSTSSASQRSGLVLDSHLRVWGFGDTKSTIIYTLVTCEKWWRFLYIWGKWSSFTNLKEGFLPSGKHTNSYGISPFYSWENPLFLWPFSIAFCMCTRPGTRWFLGSLPSQSAGGTPTPRTSPIFGSWRCGSSSDLGTNGTMKRHVGGVLK